MIKLKNLIREGNFGQSGKLTLIANLPMFSVYVPKSNVPEKILQSYYLNKVKIECAKARDEIHRLGFPSMHANIVLRDLSDEFNQNTGRTGDVAGLARHYKKYMELDPKSGITSSTIVHEWAHLWMMNNSKAFKKSIHFLYKNIIQQAGSQVDPTDGGKKPLYSFEDERKFLNKWASGVENVFKWILHDREAKSYILKNKKLTPDLFEYLPHLIHINGILKQDLPVKSLHNRSITIPKGTKVDVEKGSSGWLIGNEMDGSRYETLIEGGYDQIFYYVNSINPQGNITQDLERAVRIDQSRKERKQYYTIPYLESKILQDLHTSMNSLVDELCRMFNVKSTNEEIELIKSWVTQYIFPKILEILKSRKLLDWAERNPESLYDFLWVNNKLKPSGTSFIELFKKILQREKIKNYKDEFSQRGSFSGEELEEDRNTLMRLANWVNSYGMSNEDELWATAIEKFFKLSKNYQKIIIKLMLRLQ